MKQHSPFFSIFLILCLSTSVLSQESEINPPPSSESPSLFWLQFGIPVGAAIISCGTLFIVNKMIEKKQLRDSVISSVENNWRTIRPLIEKDNYREAVESLKRIESEIDKYQMYCKANKKSQIVFRDTVQQLLINSKFLDSLAPQIKLVMSWADSIPENTDDLTSQDRHLIISIKDRCKDAINKEIKNNPNKKGAIRFGFRRPIIKINRLDSLFDAIYDQERNAFSIKNKFFYNRAVQTNDTIQIRKFVEDCDYYQVDKEWCTRARLILNSIDTQSVDTVKLSDTIKLNEIEQMRLQYQQAMVSGRIDLLEQYFIKYNKKRIRKSESKIDSIKIMLKKIKTEVDNDMAYNKAHPLIANADLSQIQISVNGLPQPVHDKIVKTVYENLDQLKTIQGIRFPLRLQFECAGSNPIILLNASFNCRKDVQITVTDSSKIYTINGLPQLMLFLNRIKKTTSESLDDEEVARKLNLAAYAIRLQKSTEEYVTFYGKENTKHDNSKDKFLFYDFFDLTVQDQKDLRFTNTPTHSIEILQSENESQKYLLGTLFFED